jgi:hypothetical protein
MAGTAIVVTRSGSPKTKLHHFCCNLFVCRNINVYFLVTCLEIWVIHTHIFFLNYLENRKTKTEKRAEHTRVCVFHTALTKVVGINVLLVSLEACAEICMDLLHLTVRFNLEIYKFKIKCFDNYY